MNDLIKLQDQMLAAHRLQLDAAKQMADAAGHSIKLQKSMMDAAQSNMRAWDSWLGLWGVKSK